ncbi:hypothetical protein IDH44_17165 [Paenibacillus sp. IB182496]|uniref:Uncharacterized protein n=1 Tax=Paenibacillus sabuli TaxID=2772509 RepID=A0A927GTB7_9BACL|nr:hypothetical protein [Paenibacillus sabuli]MBD2846930.1 hypothetical protein [Paenibacillus sabuli]
MELQQFVTGTLEAMGGIVVAREYALCEAVVPEEAASWFQNKTELLLAFDFEVAEENPEAEFVTFGSYVFEQLMAFVREQTRATVRFADLDRPHVQHAEDKIRRTLAVQQARLHIASEQAAWGAWLVFGFRFVYLSDEREEQFGVIWVDAQRGVIDDEMAGLAAATPFADRMPYELELAVQPDLGTSYRIAYRDAALRARNTGPSSGSEAKLDRELERLEGYYRQMAQETEKRMQRKGLSEEKRNELADKLVSIEAEAEKQKQDIRDKLTVRIEVELDYAQVYFVPIIQYEVNLQERGAYTTKRLYYQTLRKQFVEIAQSL